MQGIFNSDKDLRNASLDEIRQVLQELLAELRFRLPELARILLKTQGITVEKGIIKVDGKAVQMEETE